MTLLRRLRTKPLPDEDKRKATWAKIVQALPELDREIIKVGALINANIYHTGQTIFTRLAYVYWSENLDGDPPTSQR